MSEVKEQVRFAAGDMAVYPTHGVGQIETIKVQKVGGIDQTFYVLKLLESGMTIMIPTTSSRTIGLRPVISQNEVKQVEDILRDRDSKISTQTWNRRYRDYMDKIKTGSAFEVATVVRDLLVLKSDKELSYGERKMMDTAKGLLIRELSVARQMDEEQVEQQLEEIFA